MRPDNKKDKFTDVLKQNWLNDLDKKDILCVFDDRQKVRYVEQLSLVFRYVIFLKYKI